MKYLSLLIFGAALYWSWSLVHGPADVSQEEHMEVQAQLQETLHAVLKKAYPDSESFQWERMWTEPSGHNKIKAHFRYSFDEVDSKVGATRVAKEGTIHLERTTNTDNESIWEFASLSNVQPEVEFKEPLYIQVGGPDDEDDSDGGESEVGTDSKEKND